MRTFLVTFGFLLAVAYCPFIEGAAATPRWLLLAMVVPAALVILLLVGRTVEVTAAHIAGGALLGWAVLSMAWSETHYDSMDALWKLMLLGGCFALGSSVQVWPKDSPSIWIGDDWRPFLGGCALGLGVSSGLVLVEAATGWHVEMLSGARAVTPYAALFGNRNYLAEAAALVLVGLVATEGLFSGRRWPSVRFWLLAGCLVPALAFTHARGALLALLVALGVMFWPDRWHRYRWPVVALSIAAFCGMAYLWSGQSSVEDRLHIWADAVRGLSLFGHGIGSFGGTLPQFAYYTDPMVVRQVYAHNDLLQVAYELGLPGLVLALAFIWLVLQSDRSERFVFLALIVESIFAFPNHLPVTGAVGALLAGCSARSLPRFCVADVFGRDRLYARFGLDGDD